MTTLGSGENEARVRVLARDASTLFAFWELGSETEQLRRSAGRRVADLAQWRLRTQAGGACREIVIDGERGTASLPVLVPGEGHRVQLGVLLPSGRFVPVAASNVATPAAAEIARQRATTALAMSWKTGGVLEIGAVQLRLATGSNWRRAARAPARERSPGASDGWQWGSDSWPGASDRLVR